MWNIRNIFRQIELSFHIFNTNTMPTDIYVNMTYAIKLNQQNQFQSSAAV